MNNEMKELIKIIEEYEGNEYFEGGIAYYLAVDKLNISENLIKAIKEYFEMLIPGKIVFKLGFPNLAFLIFNLDSSECFNPKK